MNNKEFIKELSTRTRFTQNGAQKLVRTIISFMGNCFEEGETVTLQGFGTFEVKKRQERTMVNPSSGKTMLVPPKLVLNFRPTSTIKEILKQQPNEKNPKDDGGTIQ